ncbi:MAG: glycosyl hydrolase, partial [Firmicutes bacterium]|nr:glycosyl hydrolase [Bacillota bacterium]
INLVFDQISNAAGAALTMSNGMPEGVNVLCPTWFSFKDEGGEIVNKANADYVDWAHRNGVRVWGLVTDNFDASVSGAVLTDDKTREYAIKQIIAYAETYDLDGINIDFEAVPKADGEYWTQFLRELAPACKSRGLTLSCDLFVPRPWSLYYNRKEVGKIVDYAIVMGYDEHYGGSDEAGSVASLSWSDTAVHGSLDAGIPKEKLILGIPFYTRIWTEKNGELTSSAYSMTAADEILKENDANFSYDEITEQNYAEYTDEEGRHRCWIEDEQSVKKRVETAVRYDTAGIAAWKLRMEKDGIAHIIKETLTN